MGTQAQEMELNGSKKFNHKEWLSERKSNAKRFLKEYEENDKKIEEHNQKIAKKNIKINTTIFSKIKDTRTEEDLENSDVDNEIWRDEHVY